MTDFLVALGLVLVIEGVIYAAFPEGMKRFLVSVLSIPAGTLRGAGLAAAAIGLIIVWSVRGAGP